ncbi:MAG: fluoride efflux transporter CrcB [Armatimonadota bacterium]
MTLLWIALGGAAGSVTRYLLGSWLTARVGAGFPWATLAINITGSFLLGLLYAVGRERLPEPVRLGLGVGVLGGFTTFSTFSVELLQLLARGQSAQAAGYAAASLLFGVLAAAAGAALGSRWS